MTQKSLLWSCWLMVLAALALSAALPITLGPTVPWWPDARSDVLTFALTLLAMTAGVGSLAIRETLVRSVASGAVSPQTPEGAFTVRSSLLRAWILCLIVGLLGFCVAWVSASPIRALPYALGAGALLLFHSPRRSEFSRP
jgi:hypothetical protein